MKNIEEEIKRVNSFLNQDFGKVKAVKDKSIELLLVESLRRSIIWKSVLGQKARVYYFAHILDDVANSVNEEWEFSSNEDIRVELPKRMDKKDKRIIDNFLNWENNSDELFSMYHLPNPYEPLICLFEIGSGGLIDLENRIEVRTLKKFYVSDLMKNMNLLEQQVVLDVSLL